MGALRLTRLRADSPHKSVPSCRCKQRLLKGRHPLTGSAINTPARLGGLASGGALLFPLLSFFWGCSSCCSFCSFFARFGVGSRLRRLPCWCPVFRCCSCPFGCRSLFPLSVGRPRSACSLGRLSVLSGAFRAWRSSAFLALRPLLLPLGAFVVRCLARLACWVGVAFPRPRSLPFGRPVSCGVFCPLLSPVVRALCRSSGCGLSCRRRRRRRRRGDPRLQIQTKSEKELLT